MPGSFSEAPHAASGLAPFTFSIPTEEIDALNTLLKRPLPKATWENSQNDRRFGVTRDWVANAVSHWQAYDWNKYEGRINSVPNFKIPIEDEGETYHVHFAALFSSNKAATPILLSHGWPGSFLEFLPILNKLQEQYASDPASLPYHLIVPSLPGYGFTPIPVSIDMTTHHAARILNKLMIKLGFNQYVAQGGDIGSIITQVLVNRFDECIAGHVNLLELSPPEGKDVAPPTEMEQRTLDAGKEFKKIGMAYSGLHATKPATAGLTIASSPQALLAWIGEKMTDWTDEQLPLQTILDNISLYWFTGCYPSSIWPYRELMAPHGKINTDLWHVPDNGKPFGYSWFPLELATCPKSWALATGNITFYRSHDKGGHFAALEQPDLLWQDIVEFVDHT